MMDPILIYELIAGVTVGGLLIGGGVHFIPVGGAPAAIATATGVGTGTAMLAAGGGMTGLITAAAATGPVYPIWLVMLAGAAGSALMLGITMLVGNWVYVWGVGCVPSSAKVDRDPITGLEQSKFVTPGTEGHGIPTVCFVSGIIGGLLGGMGGGLIYYVLYNGLVTLPAYALLPGQSTSVSAAMLAGIFALGVFFVNAVIASYNIGGTIEGFHDPKFKRLPRGALACIVASIVIGIVGVLLLQGGTF